MKLKLKTELKLSRLQCWQKSILHHWCFVARKKQARVSFTFDESVGCFTVLWSRKHESYDYSNLENQLSRSKEIKIPERRSNKDLK